MKTNPPLPDLIHFFGPDGAGKSVQTDILVDSLNRRGFHVKKCWVRAHHTAAFVLWKLIVRIGFYRTVKNFFGAERKLPAFDRNKLLRQLWSAVEFVSVLPAIWRVNISILKGNRFVAERYLLDTVTSIAYVINDISFLQGKISEIILRLIPKNTVFIFLDSDYATILKRRMPRNVPDDPIGKNSSLKKHLSESSVEPRVFIEFQRTSYKILADCFNALVIDTSKSSIDETSRTIVQYLGLI